VNGHAPEKGYFPPTENRVNGYAPENGTRERACSGIWVVLLQFFVFSSCLKPIFGANGHEKRGFEWSTFSLKLKCFYSKVGGYAPEYVGWDLMLHFSPCKSYWTESSSNDCKDLKYDSWKSSHG
jgi:hypothetical protein